MPFGAKTASQTYMRLMDKLLAAHKEYACAYIDDAPIYSNTWSDHVSHLRKVYGELSLLCELVNVNYVNWYL